VAYDEDITNKPESDALPYSENSCFVITVLVTILMFVIGLSTLYNYINDPIPAVLTLGLTALTLSILYLATVIKNSATTK
jgi:hypothetical protein